MGNRGIICLFERMFQEIISCLSPRRTIKFWLLFAQNFIKVHGNNTALTWNTGLWNFNRLFCMDFATFMCFLRKLRPSSCFILNHKYLLVDPGAPLFDCQNHIQHCIRLISKRKAPRILTSSYKKSPCRIFLRSQKKYGCNISFVVFEILQILKSIRTHLNPSETV